MVETAGYMHEVTPTPESLLAEIERLREDCAQAYQAVGVIAERLGYWGAECPNHAQLTKLLDNLSAAAEGDPRPHDDLLPFGLEP